jgi:hypothetical protein
VRGIQSGTYEAERPELRARYRVFDVEAAARGRARVVGESLRVFDPGTDRFVAEPSAVDLAVAG